NNLTIQNEDNNKNFLFSVPNHFCNYNDYDKLNAYLDSSPKTACNYLSIPATHASAEQLFSESKNIVTFERNRLKSNTIQAIIYLK
ncbi:39945_t:CDS:2, partial [Gigaspora margarita]